MAQTRSLSAQESKVVLALTERRRREATRAEIVELLGGSAKAADHVIQSLRRKGIRDRVVQLAAKSRKTWLVSPAHARRFKDVIGYDETWRIFVNASREQLHSSAGLGRRKSIR